MQPEHGGRIILRRREPSPEMASYFFEALIKDRVWSGRAEVSQADGTVRFGQWADEAAPEWLCELAKSALRVAWRNRETEGWPPRITRWRLEVPSRS